MCSLHACGESLTCVFGCIDFGGGGGGGGIPGFDLACLGGCVTQTCPASRGFLQNVVNCAIGAFTSGACAGGGGGGGLGCVMTQCSAQITACLGDRGC